MVKLNPKTSVMTLNANSRNTVVKNRDYILPTSG